MNKELEEYRRERDAIIEEIGNFDEEDFVKSGISLEEYTNPNEEVIQRLIDYVSVEYDQTSVYTDTDEEYILKITTDGTDFLTPNLKGAGDNIFVGIDVDGETGDIIVDVTDARLGDIYINSDNGNMYMREDLNGLENNWTFKGNIKAI